ncbi:hypothetical protein Ae201684P_003654 [Aphanomyces euteiches]|uniref:Integrase catalytic domain-containing protein n=1 Tax=Aphanomyces euteiches TaxID=100861 RepID=A0A6G0WNY6_9STRA|nr:hypothetical protein Ae201684_013341 [Aphanomyces euteiches]KAH9064875.1 hypothetical protein Ae201684P_003654 [Aphanomyces euteiches]
MQGHVDSALYVQATSEDCYVPLLNKHLLVWIDDILVYADDPDEYTAVLDKFFDLVHKYGFKLSPTKTKLYTKQVKWCGRYLSEAGVKQDPERIEALCAIPGPTNAGDLQQFICATNWLRESITEYAQTINPLQRCRVGHSDRPDERRAFDAVKAKLRAAVELAHPLDDATMCLFTDASDTGWSIIVTQVLAFNVDVPIQDQNHQMLVCQSGMFTGAQLNWSVIEKEAYPIARACDKLNYLLMRPDGFRMYCDHENLIQVFAPHAEWKTYQRQKLTRWAAIIGGYRYVIEHIKGANNLWADLMSRWGQMRPPGVTMDPAKVRRGHGWTKKRRPTTQVVSPSGQHRLRPVDDPEFVWPTIDEISRAQAKFVNSKPAKADLRDGLWMVADRIWIPANAGDLIQRIMIVAHCGSMRHRGEAALVQHVQRKFQVDKIHQLAKKFIAACLLCPHVKGGRVLHRPYASRWHATKPNEGIHFDYLYMGPSKSGPKYILVLKDDLSHYCELVACDAPTSQVCVDALAAWWSRHSMPLVWISDQGSHFKNSVMKGLAHKFKAEHEFTLAYCPWRNGTVERLNRDILQVMRVLLLEYKLADHQ